MDDDYAVPVMTPAQVRAARSKLGQMWALGRPASPTELALELGLGGQDPGLVVVRWENGKSQPSGPCSRLLQALLAGYRPSRLPHQPRALTRLPGRSQGGV
jgi:hypothetical protein